MILHNLPFGHVKHQRWHLLVGILEVSKTHEGAEGGMLWVFAIVESKYFRERIVLKKSVDVYEVLLGTD